MKIGQKVKTFRNEIGIISHESHREEWDWWVDIEFSAKGTKYHCREPYKEEELTVYEDKSDSSD
jgi:hypothetical protein